MIKNTSPILSALRAASHNEAGAVEFLEKQRWAGCPACPVCGDVDVYEMKTGDARNKDFRWRCRGCKKMFTVRTGTVFAETRLPLRIWVYAIWKACSSKNGISALQLSREMEITHKSALFILRRIRHGMGEVNPEKLTGTIEVDELYVGGRPRYKGISKKGRGTSKTPVLGVVQRGGDVRFLMMERKPAREFEGGHEVVKHKAGEYVKVGTDIHSNTVEGVFSLIRRGVMGTFHSISRKHLGAGPPLHHHQPGLPHPSRFSKGEHHGRWHHAIFLTRSSAFPASFTRTGKMRGQTGRSRFFRG